MSPEIIFANDFDARTYMLSGDRDAGDWTVVVHCRDGGEIVASPDHFSPYPGCETHQGKIAWDVDRYGAEKIEIRRPGRRSVFVRHPDRGL